ncbi:MAG TPA: hypothetical protein DCY27_06270 [Desulfobacterales bacterium]|nr:hypothetical protein [Desulfobacterales bacterium]
MNKINVLILTLVLFIGAAAPASGLKISLYTSKALWLADLGSQYQEETFTDNILHDPGIQFTSPQGVIRLEEYHDILNSWSNNSGFTLWSFADEIYGFGGDWTLGGPGGSGNSLTVTMIADGSSYPVGVLGSGYNNDFWGFISSDAPLTEVLLVGGTGKNQQSYTLDNMVYGTLCANSVFFADVKAASTPIPLPGTLLLLASGFIPLILLRSRR